ncbi:MAG: alanyl-tRNA editing protein, partial [Firmicutes bacterium]|nr:alanyl-tRNA editing protein [Bacillota bacterium]
MDYTTRLYDSEPYLTEAEACVTQSLSFGEGFAIILDRSCFFPGGGGQDGDTGTLDGQQVRKVFEKEGVIHHVVDQPISKGKRVMITIDGHKRRRDIEIHTGEHILSGMALSLLGVKNVGFHMGREFATADFDRVLTEEEVDRLELAVNEKIRENTPVLVE